MKHIRMFVKVVGATILLGLGVGCIAAIAGCEDSSLVHHFDED